MLVTQFKKLASYFSVRENSQHLFQYAAYSFVFTWLLLLAFLTNAPGEIDMFNGLYALSIPLYYYLIFLFLITLLLPVLWLKHLTVLILLPKIVFDIVLIGDFFLFGVYRFHVDMMFINMMIHDFKGIGISMGLVALSLLVAGLVAFVNIWLYRRCQSFPRLKLYKINFSIFGLFIVGQMAHVVAYDYHQVKYTKFTPLFPYYAPLTSYSLMAKLKTAYPETFPAVAESGKGQVSSILNANEAGLLQYPLNPLSCQAKAETLPNILIFVAESWRQDVMDEQVTPNIYAFGKSATQFTNHYSGGNVTVNGLFSLMYGLHPTYRDFMTSEPFQNQTLLTKTLAKLGYDIDVYTSSNLDRFSLKPLFFGDIADENYHNPLDGNLMENDRLAIDQLLADLMQPSEKPWFKFVFVSSSHHNYQYPETLEKFTPIEKNTEKFLFNKDMDPTPLFNRYKNSVVYIDHLFGQIWERLNETGQSDKTLTMVTSDHGEEFNDNGLGYWGHGNNFTKVQLAVPMLLKTPQPLETTAIQHQTLPPIVSSLSSHIDVVPTILQTYGRCENLLTDYSNGENLFALPPARSGIIAASYKDKAYVVKDKVYATGLTVESYDINDIKQVNEQFDYPGLNLLKQQESHLLQR